MPSDGKRDVPDVAILAGDPRVFFGGDDNGQGIIVCCVFGTSLAAPLWAGITKDIEAEIGALGSINPTVYQLANQQFGGSAIPNGFHDVTSGDNSFNGVTGFTAGPGYDEATGWGSVDFSVFEIAFTSNKPSPTPTPTATTTVTSSPASVNFGDVDASGSSTSHKVSFINKGAIAATLGTVSVPTGFHLASDECSNETVPARKSCAVEVQFEPQTPVPASGQLSVSYNGTSPATVNLSGDGTMVVVKGPAKVVFPAQAAGSTGPSRPVTIVNDSRTASVTFGSTPTIQGPFVKGSDGCSGQKIGPRGHCVIDLAFSPPGGSSSGAATGSLSLSYTYGSNPGTVPSVALSGTVK